MDEFSIGLLNCYDSVVFFVFHFFLLFDLIINITGNVLNKVENVFFLFSGP